jgi:hypothetical protein
MLGVDALDALGCGHEAHEDHRSCARFLDLRDRRDAGVSRRQHRVEDDGIALGEVGGELDVVLDRLERLLVAIEADEADPGAGDEREDAVEHAHAGPQHRADRHLLARDPLDDRALERGLDLDVLGRKVLRRLVGEQQRHLVRDLAEMDGGRVLLAQVRELVLNQRMRDLDDLGRRDRHDYAS